MSWSLQLTNGDLVVGQASLAAVNGPSKLQQDLRCFILEQMGTDDMHPGFGSLIDGGTTLNGVYNPGVIGVVNDDTAATFVRSEMVRICNEYQAGQLDRARNDQAIYGKATLDRNEVLLRLDSVEIQQTVDSMTVRLTITTGSNIQTTVDITV